MGTFLDLTGKKFGRLIAVSPCGKNRSGGYKWNVRCDCGGEKILPSDHLVRRVEPVVSCGCALVDSNRSAFDPHQTAFNLLLGSYKKRARLKNREFKLTLEEFKQITQCDCVYCGQSPQTIAFNRPKSGQYVHNGIDRVDPNKGYIEGNCVPCCKLCNYMKLSLSENEFLSHVAAISRFQNEIRHA